MGYDLMLTIEEWYGPFDKPRTMLTERDSSGNFLRRFDLTGTEWVEARAEAFSIKPPSPPLKLLSDV